MTAEAEVRLLVVEDEEALAEGLRFNLERKHYTVDVARDRRAALAQAGQHRYDLIILDVRGSETGWDLRRSWCGWPRRPWQAQQRQERNQRHGKPSTH